MMSLLVAKCMKGRQAEIFVGPEFVTEIRAYLVRSAQGGQRRLQSAELVDVGRTKCEKVDVAIIGVAEVSIAEWRSATR
jgi:hypothetical protein